MGFETAIEFLGFLLFLGFFSYFSYVIKALDINGILIANSLAIFIYLFSGIQELFVVIVFFIVSEISTKYTYYVKGIKHEKRTTNNILSNTLAGLAALFFGKIYAFYACIAAGFADTLASEIGLTFGKKTVLITNPFKEVKKGTDGGISVQGTIAAIFASATIALLYYYFYANATISTVIFISGILGMLIDSILGALLERKRIINNWQTNLIATSFASAFSFLLIEFFMPLL